MGTIIIRLNDGIADSSDLHKGFPFQFKIKQRMLILINHVPLVSACSTPASALYKHICCYGEGFFFYTLLKYVRG